MKGDLDELAIKSLNAYCERIFEKILKYTQRKMSGKIPDL